MVGKPEVMAKILVNALTEQVQSRYTSSPTSLASPPFDERMELL